MKLNLVANTTEEKKVLEYLENNVSLILADKINNGVEIVKDESPLLSKKTLQDFMQYACSEAQKIASKGARCACIDDDIVYGWAIHYFEEDSIEGKLYNLDGTEYKPKQKYTPPVKTNIVQTVKKTDTQMSFFESLDNEEKEEPAEESTTSNLYNVDYETGEIVEKSTGTIALLHNIFGNDLEVIL